MWSQLFLGFLGLSSGVIIAGGIVGLLIGLAIVPRYAGITHTGRYIMLYEDMALLGAVLGNIYQIFQLTFISSRFFLLALGLFFGIFLGGWVMALAEVADIFPIFTRRIKLTQGLPKIILSVAFGKAIGSLFYYYKGW